MKGATFRPIPHYTKSCLKSHFSGTFQASCHGDHFEKRAKVKSACCLQSNTSTLFQGNFLPFQDTFLTFLQPFDFFRMCSLSYLSVVVSCELSTMPRVMFSQELEGKLIELWSGYLRRPPAGTVRRSYAGGDRHQAEFVC